MPNLIHLEKYLESLQQDRDQIVAGIDSEIQEVEAMIARHSSNGSSPAVPDAPMLPGIAPTRAKPADRPSFTPKYQGVSLGTLIVEALKPQNLDRGELKRNLAKRGYDYGGRAIDTTLRRLEQKGKVRKVPVPPGRSGNFRNLWELVK